MKKYPYPSIKNEIIKIISEFKLKSDKLSKMMEEESDEEMYYEEECDEDEEDYVESENDILVN